MKIFGQAEGRFPATDGDPLYGSAFWLEAVQLVSIGGKYSGWVTQEKMSLDKYSGETLIPVGKNMKEWIETKRNISEDYCECINFLTKGNIAPFKQVVALKIRYLGEPKDVSHVFHYYAPRNP